MCPGIAGGFPGDLPQGGCSHSWKDHGVQHRLPLTRALHPWFWSVTLLVQERRVGRRKTRDPNGRWLQGQLSGSQLGMFLSQGHWAMSGDICLAMLQGLWDLSSLTRTGPPGHSHPGSPHPAWSLLSLKVPLYHVHDIFLASCLTRTHPAAVGVTWVSFFLSLESMSFAGRPENDLVPC